MSTREIIMSAAGVGGDLSSFIMTDGGASGTTTSGGRLALDSTGNVYVCGYTNAVTPTQTAAYIAKYTSNGVLIWKTSLQGTANDTLSSIALDTSGNVYAIGTTSSSAAARFLIVKYNSSGTLQWQKKYGDGYTNLNGTCISIDNSNNIFISGNGTYGSFNPALFIAKLNTSGVVQWKKTFYYNSFSSYTASASGGSAINGEFYFGGYYLGPTTQDLVGLVGKLDSSGNLSTSIGWNGPNYNSDYTTSVCVASSGNIYFVGTQNTIPTIFKFDSSWSLVWRYGINPGNSRANYFSLNIDGNENIYVVGKTYSNPYDNLTILKYNSSGVLQWQRYITGAGSTIGYDIAIRNNDMFISGNTNIGGIAKLLLIKLPISGNLTGTYGSYTYQASSFASYNAALSFVSPGLTVQTPTATIADTTLTSATPSTSVTVYTKS